MKHLGIIILNWNGLSQTLECLRSIAGMTSLPATILVIDNGSKPAQDQQLQVAAPLPITVLRSEQNLGFSGGMNLGIQTLIKNPEIQQVLLLNNDTVVTPEALPQLVKSLETSHVGLVGARMMRKSHLDQIENRGLGISSWGLAWNITQLEVTPSLAGGGCVLLARGLIEQLLKEGEVFDERLFLYFEDVDLGLRARALGWRGITNDQAIVQHTGGASSQQTPDIPLYYWHRNSVWVVVKNYPTVVLVMNIIPFVLLHLGISIIYVFKGKGRIVCKAKWDALKGLPQVLKQRHAREHRLSYHEFKTLKHSNISAVHAWKSSLQF